MKYLMFVSLSDFPAVGTADREAVYYAVDTDTTYRCNGTAYVAKIPPLTSQLSGTVWQYTKP